MGLFKKRRSRDDEPADPDERSPQLGVKFKDLAVMGQIMKAGGDLSESREAIYYCYAGSDATAESMAAEAAEMGFHTEVRDPLPQYPKQWSVICTANAVLTPVFVRETTDFFEDLASRHGAEYDGWEASVKPSSGRT